LRNGDRLIAFNGHSLVDPHHALAAYGALRTPANRLVLEIERNGSPAFLVYEIRD
jgi:type II secretory pathway component PulC